MKLLRSYKKKSEIPEWGIGLYEEKDGLWIRKVDVELESDPEADDDDDGDRKNRDSFRDNNRALRKEITEVKQENARFAKLMEGINPEDFKQFQSQVAKVRDEEEQGLLKSGNYDEWFKRKTKKLVDEKDTEIRNLRKANDELTSKNTVMTGTFTRQKAQAKVKAVIDKKGLRIRKYADEDLATRIDQDWTSDESGNLVLKNKDLLNEKGEEVDVDTYVQKELLERRDYFFEPAKGGGAGGSDDTGNPKNANTVKRDPVEMGRHAEAIAKGEKKVAPRT